MHGIHYCYFISFLAEFATWHAEALARKIAAKSSQEDARYPHISTFPLN
jgi:hypothetical protein